MVVDDNNSFTDAVSHLLVADGFDMVGAAADHEHGLELISDLCPDVALVDLYLGEGNGLDLIADIVRSGLAERMFMILMSSCAPDALRTVFEGSDADAYLPKTELSGDAIRDSLGGML
ncbi:hypothetical protein GCM10023191_001040 [Actinoallomurus oryzae]|uniref:Response regulatory domain-containing protein n=1 Tax=Actinoallomurus oryzae TaxID=502180 RepID=A0ABP8P7F2_9ACTN